MIEKPASMAINETKENLINVCNKSNLHISVLQLIVKELHEEINKTAQKVLEDEREEYEKAISQPDEEVKE